MIPDTLSEIPAREIRKGDMVCLSLGCRIERVIKVEPSHWPNDPATPTILISFKGDRPGDGQHFLSGRPVYVIRKGA
jgi:hypothetical protein